MLYQHPQVNTEASPDLNTSFDTTGTLRKGIAAVLIAATALFSGCAKSSDEIKAERDTLPHAVVSSLLDRSEEYLGKKIVIEGSLQFVSDRSIVDYTAPLLPLVSNDPVILLLGAIPKNTTEMWYSINDPENPALKIPVHSNHELSPQTHAVSGVLRKDARGFVYFDVEHSFYLPKMEELVK